MSNTPLEMSNTPFRKGPVKVVPGIRKCSGRPIYTKAAVILLFFFCIKVLYSCREPEPLDMQYSKITLEMFDNSGHPFYRTPSDTLYSDAVAIQLSLSDSSMLYYGSNMIKAATLFSFEPAYGFSPNISYRPVQLVQDIRVFTIYDMDDTHKAGDEITDRILFAVDYGFALYQQKEEALSFANGLHYEPACSFKLFLKASVKNTKARFSVEILLDNGTILTGTTNDYPVIPSSL